MKLRNLIQGSHPKAQKRKGVCLFEWAGLRLGFSLGNLALGNLTLGNLALGNLALGNLALRNLALLNKGARTVVIGH